MERKNTIIAVVVVVIVIIVAVGAYFAFSGDDNADEDDPTVSGSVVFLVQDSEGVYFWIEGMGETVMEAFEDAVESFEIPFVASTGSSGEDNGIQSLFGLEMTTDDSGNWYWWSQYIWTGDAWSFAESYMSELTPDDTNNYMAVVYGDGNIDLSTLAVPEEEAVWDGSTDGTVFTIQSSSGLYFQVNGEGETVMDAFEDAVSTYNIPFVASTDSSGEANGIQSLFGLEMTVDDTGNWYWWSQYVWTGDAWAFAESYMNELLSADNPVFYMIYGDGSQTP